MNADKMAMNPAALAKFHEKSERGRQAKKRVEDRLMRVIDRVDVAIQFERVHAGTASQLFHARRFAKFGDNEPEDLASVLLSDDDAEALVRILASLINQARRRP